MTRPIRVYRLNVVVQPDRPLPPALRPRLFLSRSGAVHRAAVLADHGYTATVEASDPVTWPSPEGV